MSMEAPTIDSTEPSWKQALSHDELKSFHQTSDLHAWLTIAANWALVGAAFALVAFYPNIFSIVLAIFIIGARQLGMAVIMHEAAHSSLFRNRQLNDWAGNWLAAYPVFLDLAPYRRYHLRHHAHTWTERDPDLSLATPFPTTRKSLGRKIFRDLSGQTGWKRLKAIVARDLGRSQGKVQRSDAGWLALRGVVTTNLVLLAILTVFGHPLLYLLWVAAWLTTFSLTMRIRAIAEHAMISDPADPLQNTRTTLVSWWERIFIAPAMVNFHLEHHLFMQVPHYNLPALHKLLASRGVLDDACITHGYREVLRLACSRSDDGNVAGPDQTTVTFG